MANQLTFEVLKTERLPKGMCRFTISIVEEWTLQWMEKRYPGKMTTDGRHYFLTFTVMANPDEIEDLPAELSRRFILERIRGD